MATKVKKPAPETKAKPAPWGATWSGQGGQALGVKITNPGTKAQCIPVFVGDLERSSDSGFKGVEPGGTVFVNKVGDLEPGENFRRCVSASTGGFLVESCYSGVPHLYGSEPGTYRLKVAVGTRDLPALVFEYRNGGVYPTRDSE